MNLKKVKISDFWSFQIIGWTLYISKEIGESGFGYLFESGLAVLRTFLVFGAFFLITIVLRYICRYLYRKVKSLVKIILLISAISIFFSLIWLEFRIYISSLLYAGERYADYFSGEMNYMYMLLSGAWVPFVWCILYFSIRYWRDMNSEMERAQKAIMFAQRSQLKMLRYQLNPHFLFNSLNSILALVRENPDQAELMVTELSEFLRSSLQYNDRLLIPISEELEITRKYLAIESIRYEERLEYIIDASEKISDIMIPCFITQPLVENSIRHGLKSNALGIKILINAFISVDQLIIEVANTGRLAENWSFGVGLKNIHDRLENSYLGNFGFSLIEEKGFVIARISINIKNEKINSPYN
jgi:two-component system LytT family sensor kinase